MLRIVLLLLLGQAVGLVLKAAVREELDGLLVKALLQQPAGPRLGSGQALVVWGGHLGKAHRQVDDRGLRSPQRAQGLCPSVATITVGALGLVVLGVCQKTLECLLKLAVGRLVGLLQLVDGPRIRWYQLQAHEAHVTAIEVALMRGQKASQPLAGNQLADHVVLDGVDRVIGAVVVAVCLGLCLKGRGGASLPIAPRAHVREGAGKAFPCRRLFLCPCQRVVEEPP